MDNRLYSIKALLKEWGQWANSGMAYLGSNSAWDQVTNTGGRGFEGSNPEMELVDHVIKQLAVIDRAAIRAQFYKQTGCKKSTLDDACKSFMVLHDDLIQDGALVNAKIY